MRWRARGLSSLAWRSPAVAGRTLRPPNWRWLDAQADLEQKKKDYARYQALYEKDEIPGQTRDLAATNVTRAQATYERDQQIYNELVEGTRKEELDVDRANLHQAKQNVEMSRIRLAYTVLRAPFNGVVLERQAELGEVVLPGTPIVTLADVDHLWVRVYVPETDLGKVHWGQAAEVRTDSFPGQNVSRARRVHFFGSRVHSQKRADGEGARDPGLPRQGRCGESSERVEAGNAGGCRCQTAVAGSS